MAILRDKRKPEESVAREVSRPEMHSQLPVCEANLGTLRAVALHEKVSGMGTRISWKTA